MGFARAGYGGALAAWLGFTLPSAVALILFALGLSAWGATLPDGILAGLKIAAVAVVAQAVWGMAKAICTDSRRITLMAMTCCLILAWPGVWAQLGGIVAAGLAGLVLFRSSGQQAHEPLQISVRRRTGAAFLTVFFVLLAALPMLALAWPSQAMSMLDVFYRAGSLVFGGGHVILPLLQAEVVPRGWVTTEMFLAGYGAAQAVPGPLFTFAAFLGAAIAAPGNGWLGGLFCLVAIFVPSFLIVLGALPFWERLRTSPRMQAAMFGVNAAVVGLLLAALYDPVWTSAIHRPVDFGLALIVFVALMFWRIPPWCVVLGSGLGGWLLGTLS